MCSSRDLLEGSPPYDIVFCRNLLIYLERHGPCFACWRQSTGCLRPMVYFSSVMPTGSTWLGVEPKFTAVGDPGCFAYRPKAHGTPAVLHFTLKPLATNVEACFRPPVRCPARLPAVPLPPPS